MNALYKFLDKLLGQQNFVSQLNANTLFATDNWNTIHDDLEDKNGLLKKIMDKFPAVKASDYKFTTTDGLVFGATGVAFCFMMYNFISGNAKVSIMSDYNTFKEFCRSTTAKIRGNSRDISTSSTNEQGDI